MPFLELGSQIMPEQFSSEQRSMVMSRVRSKDTGPEIAVRQALHQRGFRFRVDVNNLPGRPDIVLKKYSTVVFVHGCLWHGHQCKRFRWPVNNAEYWRTKIEKTIVRDSANQKRLQDFGWDVQVVWDCNLRPQLENLLCVMDTKRVQLGQEQGQAISIDEGED